MAVIERSEDLSAFDSAEVYFSGDLEELNRAYAEVQRVVESFDEKLGIRLKTESPSTFQDGSLLTIAKEELRTEGTSGGYWSELLGAFYFSRYGRLFVRGPIDKRSQISISKWDSMRHSLESDHGYVLVSEALLETAYDGVHGFEGISWGQRFFAPWY